MNETELRALAAEYGFSDVGFCDAVPFIKWDSLRPNMHPSALKLNADVHESVPGAKAICVLATRYSYYAEADGATISSYYIASNRAHAQAQAFEAALKQAGVAVSAPAIPAKPAAARSGIGRYGRNGLICIPGFGSAIALHCLALGNGFEQPQDGYPDGDERAALNCDRCRRCIEACPTGALSESGFDYALCLRAYMLYGSVPPEPLRSKFGGRILGCEECQRACPHNAHALRCAEPAPYEMRRLLDLSRVISPETRDEYVREFGALLGQNYANVNRLMTQALIVAANLGMRGLMPDIEALTHSPSPAVSESARWALETLKGDI